MSRPVQPSPRGEYAEVLSILQNPAGEFRWTADVAPEESQVNRALKTDPAYTVAARLDGYVRSRAATMLAPWPLTTKDEVYLWLRGAWFGPTASNVIVRTSMALGHAAGMPRTKQPRARTVSEWWIYQEDGYARDGSVLPDQTEPAQIAERAKRNARAAVVPLEWRIAGASLHWQLACREGMEVPPIHRLRGKDAQEWLESLK